ncbi:MAG: CDGSH iron-sulfur domain-containing protein [Phycisphaerales bacterium]|nr:CDGSH iron-sulfur domain-containing protein [Phycisphaerales bacterium]
MARLIKFDAQRPIKLDPQEKAVFICACGLSKNFPLCDGHHKQSLVEKPGCTYVYDAQSENPREVTEPLPVD